MTFNVTVLGANSAQPVMKRRPSAQVLNINEKLYLVDCGEGTQMQMNAFRIKKSKINHIFITHLHGDHYLGLVGLLDSLFLGGRTKPMYIYGPADLQKIIALHQQITQPNPLERKAYPIIFQEVIHGKSYTLLDDSNVTVKTIPLEHGLPCTGFLFVEKERDRKMLFKKITTYKILHTDIPSIKKGADFITADGRKIPNTELTLPPPPPRSYAYCSDTRYTEAILPIIADVDMLYHEATYLQHLAHKAAERWHSTAIEAATIAHKARAKALLLGHYSARYRDLTPFLEEARTVFDNCYLAIEGETYDLPIRKTA